MKKTKITDYIPNTIDYKYSDILDNNFVSLQYFACYEGSQIWIQKTCQRFYLYGRYLPDEIFDYTKTSKMSSAIEACHILGSFDSLDECKLFFRNVFDFLCHGCYITEPYIQKELEF